MLTNGKSEQKLASLPPLVSSPSLLPNLQPQLLQSSSGVATQGPAAMVLEEFFSHLLDKKRWGDGVMRDLEVSLRAKGPVHPADDTMLERCRKFAYFSRLLGCTLSGLSLGFLATSFLVARHPPPPLVSPSIMQILLHVPPPPVILMVGCASACMSVNSKMHYYDLQLGFAKIVLKHGEERTKIELVKIILNNHSDDKSLVAAVKRHFVADYVFSDQHQEKPFLRWRERGSFVDSTLLEKLKEFEAAWEKMMKELEATLRKALKKYEENNSDDEAKGLFQEDPLAFVLGNPGNNTEIIKPSE